jgi:hypothetical protein
MPGEMVKAAVRHGKLKVGAVVAGIVIVRC